MLSVLTGSINRYIYIFTPAVTGLDYTPFTFACAAENHSALPINWILLETSISLPESEASIFQFFWKRLAYYYWTHSQLAQKGIVMSTTSTNKKYNVYLLPLQPTTTATTCASTFVQIYNIFTSSSSVYIYIYILTIFHSSLGIV